MREIICARLSEESCRKSARVRRGSLGASERGAPKLFYFCLHMEFWDLGYAYEGHFCEQKNRIWGCAGLVGRYPVVSAPPLYHIHFCLSIGKINKKNDHFWSFFTNYPFFCLVSIKSNLISLPFLCIITNLFSFSIVKSYFFVKNSQIS